MSENFDSDERLERIEAALTDEPPANGCGTKVVLALFAVFVLSVILFAVLHALAGPSG